MGGMKSIRAMVLPTLLAVASASASHAEPTYNEETDVGMPVTVETLFAIIFVAMIASVPLILVRLKGQEELTKAHIIESAVLIIWLSGTLFLFTNVLKFGSGHFQGLRPLTLVESVYVLAQVLTTVGYGDITPALPRGQVWVAINVVLALCLYGSIIMEVTELVQDNIKTYLKEKKETESPSMAGEPTSPSPRAEEGVLKTASGAKMVTNSKIRAAPLRNWKIEADIDYGPLRNSAIAFTVSATIGVLFWHYYPGEEKTWLQAIYMSIITLSTVGFGWFNAVTEGGKVFGAFWMMFGVASLAATLTNWCEIMTKLKEVERLNEDEEKLAFFRLIARSGEDARDKDGKVLDKSKAADDFVLEDRAMDLYEFLKFGLLLTKQANEEDLQIIEDRFYGLKPNKDGLVARKVIEEAEAPPPPTMKP